MPWLLLVAVLLAALPARAEGRPSYEQIVRQFEAISFSAEGGGYARQGQFDRWHVNPIRLTVPRSDQDKRAAIETVLHELRDISGLPMGFAASGEKANVFVTFKPTGGCLMAIGRNHVEVTIARDRQERCLWAELSQMIGPTNDACVYRPSLFCDGEKNTQMTWADRLIMKATFDPRLQRGMVPDEAMPIARIILRELYDREG